MYLQTQTQSQVTVRGNQQVCFNYKAASECNRHLNLYVLLLPPSPLLVQKNKDLSLSLSKGCGNLKSGQTESIAVQDVGSSTINTLPIKSCQACTLYHLFMLIPLYWYILSGQVGSAVSPAVCLMGFFWLDMPERGGAEDASFPFMTVNH